MRINRLSVLEHDTWLGRGRILSLALLSLLCLQIGCAVQEAEQYVIEWEETREELPEILLGKWEAGDEGAVTHFTSEGEMITLLDGDTISNRPFELTDTCGPFDVPHASEVNPETNTMVKLIEEKTDARHRCYAIYWYQVDNDEGVEQLGAEFLSGASRPQFIWERELREQ